MLRVLRMTSRCLPCCHYSSTALVKPSRNDDYFGFFKSNFQGPVLQSFGNSAFGQRFDSPDSSHDLSSRIKIKKRNVQTMRKLKTVEVSLANLAACDDQLYYGNRLTILVSTTNYKSKSRNYLAQFFIHSLECVTKSNCVGHLRDLVQVLLVQSSSIEHRASSNEHRATSNEHRTSKIHLIESSVGKLWTTFLS